MKSLAIAPPISVLPPSDNDTFEVAVTEEGMNALY
jgi:hypothetical protein